MCISDKIKEIRNIMRVTKREKFFRDEILDDCYYYDEQTVKGINVDKLLLLIKYKLIEKEEKTLAQLFCAVSGKSLSYFDYYISGFTNNLKKEDKEFGYHFMNFVEDSLTNKKLNEEKFEYFLNIINGNVLDLGIRKVFHQIFSLLARDLNLDLCEKYFPEKLKELSSVELSNNSNYPMLILETINSEVESCNSRNRLTVSSPKDEVLNIIQNAQKTQKKLKALSDFIIRGSDLETSLFKLELNSSHKGRIGESLFSDAVGGSVVGHLGKKVDVKTTNDSYSIKTTYAHSWNNHLAYFNGELYEKFQETKRLSSIGKEESFQNLLLSFFKGKDDTEKLDYLILQKIKMNELNTVVEHGKAYKIPLSFIENAISSKSYIFNASELILIHDDEQFMKLNVKERTGGGQIMLVATESNLELLFKKDLIYKKEVLNNSKKNNNLKM